MHPTPPHSSSPHTRPKESCCHGWGDNSDHVLGPGSPSPPAEALLMTTWKVTFTCHCLSLRSLPAGCLFALLMPHIRHLLLSLHLGIHSGGTQTGTLTNSSSKRFLNSSTFISAAAD